MPTDARVPRRWSSVEDSVTLDSKENVMRLPAGFLCGRLLRSCAVLALPVVVLGFLPSASAQARKDVCVGGFAKVAAPSTTHFELLQAPTHFDSTIPVLNLAPAVRSAKTMALMLDAVKPVGWTVTWPHGVARRCFYVSSPLPAAITAAACVAHPCLASDVIPPPPGAIVVNNQVWSAQ